MLTYLNIEGEQSGGGAGDGLIVFSTTNASTGNDNNTISYCYIRDLTGGTMPQYGIMSTGTEDKTNSGITVDNCHFIDIFNVTNNPPACIYLYPENDNWTITNNHFYQTTDYSNLDNYSFSIILNPYLLI